MRKPVREDEVIREAKIKSVSGADTGTGQAKIKTEPPGAACQKEGRTDVREQPDPAFGHCQHRRFGDDPMRAVNRNTAATTHDNTRHEDDIGLGVASYRVIQQVFDAVHLVHEDIIATVRVHRAPVSAGTKCPLARASHENRCDCRIIPPDHQSAGKRVDQLHINDVENGGAIKHGDPDPPGTMMQKRFGAVVHVQVCLLISATIMRRSIFPVAPIGHRSNIRKSLGQNLRVIFSRSNRRLMSASVSL